LIKCFDLSTGTSGRPLPLKTNYYAIEAKNKDWQLYQYVCEFDPPIDSRKLRKGLVGEHADRLFRFYLFDGMHLYSATKLADEVNPISSPYFITCK